MCVSILQIINKYIHIKYIYIYICVTGFTKTSLLAQEMKSNLLLSITLTPLHYLEILSTYVAMDSQVCFQWQFIADSVKPPWCTTGSVGLMNGINKDMTGARLLPTTVSTCAVNWVPFCHLPKIQYCFLCPYMEGLTCLRLPTHPLHTPHPFLLTHPL